MTVIQLITDYAENRKSEFSKKELVEYLLASGITTYSAEKALQRLVKSGNIEKGSGRGL